MPNLIKDAGLYESPQHFFANYVYNMVNELVADDPTSADPSQPISLYEDKNLRQVQILLLNNISNGFEKCKFLKDEHGGPAREERSQK